MTERSELERTFRRAVRKVGRERVAEHLSRLASEGDDSVLTIIANEGVHPLPEQYHRGQVFVASQGSMDFSSSTSIRREYEKVLRRTAKKLQEQPWRTVYIVPFGPSTLSMQLKLLVYRICGIESIDLAHLGQNVRVDIKLDLRKIANAASRPKRVNRG